MSKDMPGASGVETIAPEDRNTPTEAGPTAAAAETGTIDISFSPGLTEFLESSNIALGFTSYQTGRLYLIGHGPDGKLALHEAVYPRRWA